MTLAALTHHGKATLTLAIIAVLMLVSFLALWTSHKFDGKQ